MRIEASDYYSDADWAAIRAEADRHDTPFLVLDLDIIRDKYQEMVQLFPFSKVYYAVKANPAPEIISLLAGLGFGLAQVIGGANYGLFISYVIMLITLVFHPKREAGK